LEKTFVDLTTKNIALHARKLAALGCPQPVIIQGDSRRLCEILQEADLIVSSPPYAELGANTKGHGIKGAAGSIGHGCKADQAEYGTSPGQLGAMRPGSIDCVLSSPPFMENNVNIGAVGNTLAQRQQIHDSKPRKDSYGTTAGQLGAMKPGSIDCVLASPPYSEGLTQGGGQRTETTNSGAGGDIVPRHYGTTPGNLGNLKPGDVSLICSSPPYEKAETGGKLPPDKYPQIGGKIFGYRQEHQGCSEGQLGNSQGPTFWEAARDIVAQCLQILRPGGVAIWVVKDFVRAKKRVDFTGDWRKLCEAAGFTTLHEHHAMLYKEHRFRSIWGEEIIRRTNRASFFRTLANNKAGWAAYWEIVPETERQEWLITAKEQLPPGKRQHIILGKAQELAFKDTAERIETWNEHVRIDFEVVLCMRKPE
jgi:hypothetical protein